MTYCEGWWFATPLYFFPNRNQRNCVHLRSDGGRSGPHCHALLQSGQHDWVRLRPSPAGQQRPCRGLALGRLLGPHPVWNLVQPQVHRQRCQKHVHQQGGLHTTRHEPAQHWGRTSGEHWNRTRFHPWCRTQTVANSLSFRPSTRRWRQTVVVMAFLVPVPWRPVGGRWPRSNVWASTWRTGTSTASKCRTVQRERPWGRSSAALRSTNTSSSSSTSLLTTAWRTSGGGSLAPEGGVVTGHLQDQTAATCCAAGGGTTPTWSDTCNAASASSFGAATFAAAAVRAWMTCTPVNKGIGARTCGLPDPWTTP